MARVLGSLLEGTCARMPWYTDLRTVFEALGGREREFDWLVTNLECNWYPPELSPEREARFFDGETLSSLVRRQTQRIQFIWAVLTGLDRGASLDLASLPVLPYADGHRGFWSGEPEMQYPGARVELVCFDSSMTLLLTSDADLTARFRATFPEAVDLAAYNRNR